MKKLMIAATVIGAVTAGLIIYLRDYYGTGEPKPATKIGDAANNAFDTMDKHIRKLERQTDPVLN